MIAAGHTWSVKWKFGAILAGVAMSSVGLVAFVPVMRAGAANILSATALAYWLLTVVLPASCLPVAAWFAVRRAWRWCGVVAGVGAALVGFRVYATHIEPNRLVVRRVVVRSPGIDRPIRILHMSDIQCAEVGAFQERAFARAAELKADIVFHTGDMLQPQAPATWETETPKIARLWATLHPPLGKWNVLGDVDRAMAPQLLVSGPSAMGGLRTLSSADVALTAGATRLRILGLDPIQSHGGHGVSGRVSRFMRESTGTRDFNIVFGHGPDYVLGLSPGAPRIDLCLAGHTHGGQVRLPWYGPPVTLARVPRAWARGFTKRPGFRLNVSAGLGAERAYNLPPIRVNCPPEMTLIELLPK